MSRRILPYFTTLFLFVHAGTAQPAFDSTLRQIIEKRISGKSSGRAKFTFQDFCPVESNLVADRVFREYGSIFAADDSVDIPRKCIFSSEQEVTKFQDSTETESARIGGVEIELQEAAMEALLDAVSEAQERGLRLTPLDGAIAGKRSFADTVRLWNSRLVPALNHWVARGRISRGEADASLKMSVIEQATQVFAWESKGFYFSTGKNRPIMSSVAPPGTSQHLAMLAFDIEQANDRRIREIMNRYGWFQTVVGDPPHFTFIGVAERKLPERGLKAVASGGHTYWVPNLTARTPQNPGPNGIRLTEMR
jgi:hypothetical protein